MVQSGIRLRCRGRFARRTRTFGCGHGMLLGFAPRLCYSRQTWPGEMSLPGLCRLGPLAVPLSWRRVYLAGLPPGHTGPCARSGHPMGAWQSRSACSGDLAASH